MMRLGAMLAMLLLAGCGAIGWPKTPPDPAMSPSAWARPGADAAAVEGAYNECLSLTDTATQTDFAIDQDIAATRPGDLQHVRASRATQCTGIHSDHQPRPRPGDPVFLHGGQGIQPGAPISHSPRTAEP